MNNQIQETRDRLAAATPGPWTYKQTDCEFVVFDNDICWVCTVPDNSTGNVSLIANAPEDIAYLLSQYDQLQTENEQLRTEAKNTWNYLKNERSAMKEALEWYAQMKLVCTPIHVDGGERAKSALSHLKG